MQQSDLLASVIVPARNAREHLPHLVASLARQTIARERFEVVIGDDGSDDGSTDELQTQDGWIRIASGPPRNSYAARNRAVKNSRAAVLAFCDADCRPEPEWLERGLAALEDTDIAAGRIRFLPPRRRTVWALLDMDASKDHETQVRQGTAETANLFMRRDLFDRVGGLDESVPEHGDFEFIERALRAGVHLSYAAGAVVWHPARDRARPFLRAVWIYCRWYAARESRAGRLPEALKLRSLVPVVQTYRARRRWGRSIGPDRRWLGQNGISVRTSENLVALPLMYLLIPYLRSAAQLQGWWDGRRLR